MAQDGQGNDILKKTIVNGSTNDGSTNALEIKDSDGDIVEYTDTAGFHQVRYRDEYVGGEWVDAAGAAAPDIVNVTIGGVATRMQAFDGNVTEEKKSNHFEIAHDLPIAKINDGTYKIEWHVHMRPSTNNAGDVKWFMDWSYSPQEGAPIAMTSLSCIKTINANEQYYHLLCGTELPVPVGGYEIGGIINFNLRRTPTDGDDTYGDDILLIKTALHVPTDGDGSRQRYVK